MSGNKSAAWMGFDLASATLGAAVAMVGAAAMWYSTDNAPAAESSKTKSNLDKTSMDTKNVDNEDSKCRCTAESCTCPHSNDDKQFSSPQSAEQDLNVYTLDKPHDSNLDYDLATLFQAAHEATEHAYNPYSHFHVGAAAIGVSDTLYTGANVENASYGLTICAERSCFSAAVSAGETQFKAIAITTRTSAKTSPCGSCRQFMVEFGNFPVYLVSPDNSYVVINSMDLLPFAFIPDNLANADDSISVSSD